MDGETWSNNPDENGCSAAFRPFLSMFSFSLQLVSFMIPPLRVILHVVVSKDKSGFQSYCLSVTIPLLHDVILS